MQRKIALMSGLALAAALFVTPAYAQQQVVNYNPVVPDNNADPSVAVFDGVFYLYATTDIDRGLSLAGPPVVWRSRDFVHWSFSGSLMSGIDWNKPYEYTDNKGATKTGYFRYWAPGKPLKKDGTYYLFPTIVKPDGSTGTYVMTASNPEGPFAFANGDGVYFNEPNNGKKEATPLVNDIDGEVFIDDDGSAYFYWRRRFAARLTADLLSLDGKPIEITTRHGGYSEGPFLFKRKGIYYYVYTLAGNGNYANGYMISRKGPLGPFEVPTGKDIVIQSSLENNVWGPGHGNVFQVPGTDDFYFIYLEFGEGGTTRQVGANKIIFNPDGSMQPVVPDWKGVGYLSKPGKARHHLSISGVTASSFRDPKAVKQSIETNPSDKIIIDVSKTDPGPTVQQVSRTLTYEPSHAADNNNGTRWFAKTDDASPWITFDLGATHNITECEMSFVFPALGHAWKLEKSTDGTKWQPCAAQEEVVAKSPHVAREIGKARYLRLSILKGGAGVWEMRVYGH